MASEKITAIIEELKGLTVLELSELVHAVEDEFGVSAAAAVAVADGVNIHDVNVKKVQDILAGEQDVPLPRNSHTDKSYTELCEEFQYGLYTDAAKEAAAKGQEYTKNFRQDHNYKTGADESAKNFIQH